MFDWVGFTWLKRFSVLLLPAVASILWLAIGNSTLGSGSPLFGLLWTFPGVAVSLCSARVRNHYRGTNTACRRILPWVFDWTSVRSGTGPMLRIAAFTSRWSSILAAFFILTLSWLGFCAYLLELTGFIGFVIGIASLFLMCKWYFIGYEEVETSLRSRDA